MSRSRKRGRRPDAPVLPQAVAPGKLASQEVVSAAEATSAAQTISKAPAGVSWLWPKLGLAMVVGLAVGYAGARFVLKDSAMKQYEQLKTEFDVTTSQNQYDLGDARSQLDFVRGQLAVEESTRRTLEATLQATQSELGHARDQVAFFEQLLPPGPNGSISVRALDIEQIGPTLRYRVLLMRNAPGAETFNGLMQFVANGVQHGKPVKIPLEPPQAVVKETAEAGATTDANELALSFDEFQRRGGMLSLPDGFSPKTVTLNILEGKTIRVSRTVNLTPVEPAE